MTTPDSATVTDHTRQWLEKAVIGLNLCPFAKAPHRKELFLQFGEKVLIFGTLLTVEKEWKR